MKIMLTVEVEVGHVAGKFVSKDDITEELVNEVDLANPGTVWIEDSEYEVTSMEVSA